MSGLTLCQGQEATHGYGEAAAAAGLGPRMVRRYEKIGLKPKALRRDLQYRDYSMNNVSPAAVYRSRP